MSALSADGALGVVNVIYFRLPAGTDCLRLNPSAMIVKPAIAKACATKALYDVRALPHHLPNKL
jgi:hypothetical protein